MRILRVYALLLVCAAVPLAAQQTGSIEGQVTDRTGAVIPGSAVTVLSGAQTMRSVTTNETGSYAVPGLTAGSYTVHVSTPGFAAFEKTVEVSAASVTRVDAALEVTLETQKVTVEGETVNTVSTDPSGNAGALVLKGKDLDALSDDPDELAEDLQALAGPAAGPNGGQIYVDGFSGGRLPPKSSIREVRINQNPFSAEYDRLGFGRIEILTKPGTDKLRGQAMFGFSDEALNARNPFVTNKPSFQSRLFSFNLGGPITKRASFFVDAERRDIDDNAAVNAVILNPDFSLGTYQQAVLTPHRRTSISPRIDYQLSPNHTLVARYNYVQMGNDNVGIGDFTLPERGYHTDLFEHNVQLTETAVLSATAINETRVQYVHQDSEQTGDATKPAINVLQSFNGGGAQIGQSADLENRVEIQNLTSLARGKHAIKFGGRLRVNDIANTSPRNFGGTFTFAGGVGPLLNPDFTPVLGPDGAPMLGQVTSIERYQRTEYFLSLGYAAARIRLLGGGASQYSVAGGEPLASLNPVDGALFAQDDWRLRPGLTLSFGVRYELQNYISDWTNIAPRFGFAWAPGTRKGRTGKTVIRGGVGMFYDRVGQDLVLDTIRFDGTEQEQFILKSPDFYPNAPPASELSGAEPQTVRALDPNLHAPYILQTAIGVERQLPKSTTVAVTFTNSRGVHMLRSTALPYTLNGAPDTLYQYESTGFLNQRQMIVNVNSRFSRRVSIFSFYALNFASNDTDGAGSFPANQWDYSGEYGRASNDVRHRFMFGGAMTAIRGIRLSPFIIIRSGSPFNITTGRDPQGLGIFTERPTFAGAGDSGAVATDWGTFNPIPIPGAEVVPRNYGDGPASFTINLRVSKTFGFGESRASAAAAASGDTGGGRGPGGYGGPGGGGGRGGGGGGMRMGGGGGGGMGGGFADGSTNHRYNLTVSASARNLLNTVNLNEPIGNLTSPYFGQSTGLAGGFGPGGSTANNRRIELQLRFAF